MLLLAVMHFDHRFAIVTTGLLLLSVVSCGGGTATPAASPAGNESARSDAMSVPPSQSVSRTPAVEADDEPKPPDPNESSVAIRMAPLFSRQKLPKFPKPTVGDRECWQ